MKWFWQGVLVLILVLVAGASGYILLRNFQIGRSAETACVGAAFPYYLTQAKKSELRSALDKITRDMSSLPPEKEKPKAPIMGAKIDQVFHGLMEKLNEAPGEFAQKADFFRAHFAGVDDLFKSEAPKFIKECRAIYSRIHQVCGSLEGANSSERECIHRYDKTLDDLFAKHFPVN